MFRSSLELASGRSFYSNAGARAHDVQSIPTIFLLSFFVDVGVSEICFGRSVQSAVNTRVRCYKKV